MNGTRTGQPALVRRVRLAVEVGLGESVDDAVLAGRRQVVGGAGQCGGRSSRTLRQSVTRSACLDRDPFPAPEPAPARSSRGQQVVLRLVSLSGASSEPVGHCAALLMRELGRKHPGPGTGTRQRQPTPVFPLTVGRHRRTAGGPDVLTRCCEAERRLAPSRRRHAVPAAECSGKPRTRCHGLRGSGRKHRSRQGRRPPTPAAGDGTLRTGRSAAISENSSLSGRPWSKTTTQERLRILSATTHWSGHVDRRARWCRLFDPRPPIDHQLPPEAVDTRCSLRSTSH